MMATASAIATDSHHGQLRLMATALLEPKIATM